MMQLALKNYVTAHFQATLYDGKKNKHAFAT